MLYIYNLLFFCAFLFAPNVDISFEDLLKANPHSKNTVYLIILQDLIESKFQDLYCVFDAIKIEDYELVQKIFQLQSEGLFSNVEVTVFSNNVIKFKGSIKQLIYKMKCNKQYLNDAFIQFSGIICLTKDQLKIISDSKYLFNIMQKILILSRQIFNFLKTSKSSSYVMPDIDLDLKPDLNNGKIIVDLDDIEICENFKFYIKYLILMDLFIKEKKKVQKFIIENKNLYMIQLSDKKFLKLIKDHFPKMLSEFKLNKNRKIKQSLYVDFRYFEKYFLNTYSYLYYIINFIELKCKE